MTEKIKIDLQLPIERIEISTRSNTPSDEDALRQADAMVSGLTQTIMQSLDKSNKEQKLLRRLESILQEVKELQYFKDTSVGLWCIDRDPKEVSKEWIEEHAFRLGFNNKGNDL